MATKKTSPSKNIQGKQLSAAPAPLSAEDYARVERRIREHGATLSKPPHPESVYFPKDLDEYREAFNRANGRYPKEKSGEETGGFAMQQSGFIGGLPETPIRSQRASVFTNDYDDKFYEYQRIQTAWHEYFHIAEPDQAISKAFFKDSKEAISNRNIPFHISLREQFADNAAYLAILDDQALGDRKKFLSLHQFSRSLGRDPDHNSTSTTKIVQRLYDEGVKKGTIIPGQLKIDDMMDLSMQAIKEQSPSLRNEYNASLVLYQKPNGVKEHINQLGKENEKKKDDEYCLKVSDIDSSLSTVPAKQKEDVNASKHLTGMGFERISVDELADLKKFTQQAKNNACKPGS